jgi:hypothetical protein
MSWVLSYAPPPPSKQKLMRPLNVYISVSQTFVLADLIWLRKTITDPHTLAHVNLVSGRKVIQNKKIKNKSHNRS